MVKSKILVAYYSRKGENYLNGNIVNLPVGNTEVIAKKIQKITGSDLFHIDTLQSYPADYTETTNVAKAELKRNVRPELTGKVANMDFYDVIYLGYPNWWGTFPMAVFTFLESYDFSGKTIIPFCTHEGSGLGNSERDIRKLCPNVTVLPGLAIRGGTVKNADSIINSWLLKM
jgi:flavodoxin